MKKLALAAITMSFLVILGCNKPSLTDKLIGSWEVSSYISPAETAKMINEPLPQGLTLEMTLAGSTTYHIGGKYNSDGQITVRLKNSGQEVPLNFLVRDAGTWAIHGDTLVETSTNSVVTPMDQITKNVVKESPELQTMITPVSGESASSKVVHITETMADLKLLEPPYISMVMRKKAMKSK